MSFGVAEGMYERERGRESDFTRDFNNLRPNCVGRGMGGERNGVCVRGKGVGGGSGKGCAWGWGGWGVRHGIGSGDNGTLRIGCVHTERKDAKQRSPKT